MCGGSSIDGLCGEKQDGRPSWEMWNHSGHDLTCRRKRRRCAEFQKEEKREPSIPNRVGESVWVAYRDFLLVLNESNSLWRRDGHQAGQLTHTKNTKDASCAKSFKRREEIKKTMRGINVFFYVSFLALLPRLEMDEVVEIFDSCHVGGVDRSNKTGHNRDRSSWLRRKSVNKPRVEAKKMHTRSKKGANDNKE